MAHCLTTYFLGWILYWGCCCTSCIGLGLSWLSIERRAKEMVCRYSFCLQSDKCRVLLEKQLNKTPNHTMTCLYNTVVTISNTILLTTSDPNTLSLHSWWSFKNCSISDFL